MTLKLEDFCDPTDHREYLHRPFQFDGKTIACNGHVMLILPDNGEYKPATDLHEKNIEALKKTINSFEELQFQPAPNNIAFPVEVDCPTCRGLGKATRERCPECFGEGEVDFRNDHNRYSFTCRTCEGDGEIIIKGGDTDCADCRGHGKIFPKETSRVAVYGMGVNANYLKLIINEQGLEIAIKKASSQLFFRAGDAQGIIMELRE